MNSTCYKQYDTRWGSLGYPRKPYFIKNCGCGEVSICNVLIEAEQYKSQTPKTIQPYMVQFAEPHGNGTYHSGIPTAMKHYGFTNVMEHATMAKLWVEMRKGGRVAILLMGKKPGGSKKVHWSGSGHFVAATGYKEQNGKHYLYIKDSASTSTLRNGWITYEDNIRGDCLKVWSGVPPVKKTTTTVNVSYNPTTPFTGILPTGVVKKGSKGIDVKRLQNFLNWCLNAKLAIDGSAGEATVKAIKAFQTKYKLTVDGSFGPACKAKAQTVIAQHALTDRQKKFQAYAKKLEANKFGYITYAKQKLCPICNPSKTNYGSQCIGTVGIMLKHGAGIPVSCKPAGLATDAFADKLLKASKSEALKMWRERNGDDWDIIENDKKAIPASMLKPMDVLLCYDGQKYKHMASFYGEGLIADNSSSRGMKIRSYSSLGYPCKIAFRYTGK